MTPPALVILGDSEATEVSAKQAAAIPNARFEIVPGGHEPWLYDLDACSMCILDFLSKQAS